MMPNGVSREPLRLFFTKHLLVSLVFGGDPSNGRCRDSFRMKDDPPKEIVVFPFPSRDISLSGYENSFPCVIGTQYHWELCMINPSPFPIYFWLCSSKPWVSENCLLFSKLCKVESKVGMIGSHLNL